MINANPTRQRANQTRPVRSPELKCLEDKMTALTMLLLLIPTPHRETLKALLQLCRTVVSNEATNRMGLSNVATIIAPNLFPPPSTGRGKVKTEATEQVVRRVALVREKLLCLNKKKFFLLIISFNI